MSSLPILHQDQSEFKALIQEASNEYNIGEAMTEKDYWVTWCFPIFNLKFPRVCYQLSNLITSV